MRKRLLSFVCALMIILLVGCEVNYQISETGFNEKEWELVEQSGKQTTVNLYVYGSEQSMIDWFNSAVKSEVLSLYNIRLNVIKATYSDLLAQLNDNKQNEIVKGDIDLILLSQSTDFKQLSDSELLYGPFLGSVKAYALQGNHNAIESSVIDNWSHNGYAVPFCKKSLYLIANEDYILDMPENYDELVDAIENNPSLFTFPSIEDEIGGKILRGFILHEVGYTAVATAKNQTELKKAIAPAFESLDVLRKHFYKEGKVFPATAEEMDQMFREDTVIFSASTALSHIYDEQKIENYPEGAKPITIDGLFPYESEFMVIPFNAGNKSGAMLTIQTILSIKLQSSLLALGGPNRTPVIYYDLLTDEEKILIQKVVMKKTIPKSELLMQYGISDVPMDKQKMIMELWKQHLSQNP